MKLELYLRMANIPYKVINTMNPRKAPKGKIPFVDIDGKRIGDSGLIIEYLKKTQGDTLDQYLSTNQKAQALCLERLIEEHLYWVVVWSRWADPAGWASWKEMMFSTLKWPLTLFVPHLIQKKVLKQLYEQGIARHTPEDIYGMGEADVKALANTLGDNEYVFSKSISSIDATLAAIIGAIAFVPWGYPLKESLKKHPNLIAHYNRMHDRYFPECEKINELQESSL